MSPESSIRGWRARIAFAALCAAVVVLTFADRAPRYTIDRAPELRRFGRRIEDRTGVDVLDRSDIPFAVDDLGHVALWLTMGAAVFLMLDGRRPRILGGRPIRRRSILALLVILAVSFELGQAVLTSTRNLSLSDGVANLVGAVVGMGVAAASSPLWRRRRLDPH